MVLNKSKILIYDDNRHRREALESWFKMQDDLEVVGGFNDCTKVLQQVSSLKPDLILMDISMPHVNGIEGLKLIKSNFPEVLVLMQTIHEDNDSIMQSIMSGATGYLIKDTPPAKFIEAIRETLNGGAPITPSIASRMLRMFIEKSKEASTESKYDLTLRELEVLKLLADGYSYKMIGGHFEISYHTVNSHVKKIYEKLHVHSSIEAVRKAIREKLV